MDAGKIPLSLGRECPVKCEFCYELDHSYRETLDPPKTTDEDWKFILDYISKKPTDPKQFWCLGGNEYMEWTDLFLHPKAMEWVEDFLTYTDKSIQFFTVGFVYVPKIHQLVAQFAGADQLRVVGHHAERLWPPLMPHAPSIKHLLKVLDGPAVSSANFYAFDAHTMSKDAVTIFVHQPEVCALDGHADARARVERGHGRSDAAGAEAFAGRSARIYDAGCPTSRQFIPKPIRPRFSNRKPIVSLFDSLELEKKDTVVMAASVSNPEPVPEEPRQVPLCAERDAERHRLCIFSAFDDIARRLTKEKVVHIPKCVMQSGRVPIATSQG